uniref:Hematopoietic death receptor n=1 Tax=Sphaeramia orbicularis TaxID=375764 RepID=A0A672YUL2_9TELE
GHFSWSWRTRRDVPCRDNLEYPNGNICCLNCPAGTHMKSPCSTAGKKGQCEECEYGTYTEHSMDLKQCFRCTQCRLDQEIVQPCTFTHNTECRCNQEDFVPPDQACEVCKKCSSCGKDEVIVRNCTSTSNTECKKRPPPSGSASGTVSVHLYEKSEESLRSCFEFFEDLDVNYHSRFFRLLGINDNLIKSKESLCYVDRVHDLLNVWLEKEGGDASLNDLLKALLDLNQRRTAEIIRMKAIEGCFYVRE